MKNLIFDTLEADVALEKATTVLLDTISVNDLDKFNFTDDDYSKIGSNAHNIHLRLEMALDYIHLALKSIENYNEQIEGGTV